MPALKHDSLRKLGIAAGWFILAGVFRQLDYGLSPLLSAMCFLATNLIYIALALVWGAREHAGAVALQPSPQRREGRTAGEAAAGRWH